MKCKVETFKGSEQACSNRAVTACTNPNCQTAICQQHSIQVINGDNVIGYGCSPECCTMIRIFAEKAGR